MNETKKADDQQVYIKLDAPYRVKYENIESFNDSIFSSIYAQAAQMTKEIIGKNREYQNLAKKRGNSYRNQEQIYNVISFVGGRGVGKTSCMLSFAEYLKDYYRVSKKEEFSEFYIEDELNFIGINAIDAGLLEEKEDIIEVVLARLLDAFQKLEENSGYGDSDFEFKKRRFNECLQKLYRSNQRRKQEREIDEFVSIDNLQEMAISLNMRERMKELMETYIELIQSYYHVPSFDKKSYYIVITIDDIDMNLQKGYQMLEQIRRYLMIPNVIILLSYQYEQIQDVCNRYYYDGMRAIEKLYDDKVFKKKILYLSKVYLAKVIPDGRRIVLPKVEDIERLSGKELRIIPVEGEVRDAHSVMDTFMRKISRCFDLRFWYPDAELGIWSTPNFRDLSNLYNELHILKDPCKMEGNRQNKNSTDLLKIYGENYEWLFDYIKHKAFLELPDDQYELFEKIVNDKPNELYRLVTKLSEWLLEKDTKGYYNQVAEMNRRNLELYSVKSGLNSYGNMVYLLSVIEKSDQYQKLAILLKAYISASIRNAIFLRDGKPAFLHKLLGDTKDFGYLDDLSFIKRDLEKSTLPLGRIRVKGSYAVEEFEKKDEGDESELNWKKYRDLEMIWMFIGKCDDIKSNSVGGRVTISFNNFDFSISAFIWNLLNFREHLSSLENVIKKQDSEILNWSKGKTLKSELEKWNKGGKTIKIFPFWNVDMVQYIENQLQENVGLTNIKINELQNIISDNINESALKNIKLNLEEYMDIIQKTLSKQDEYYIEKISRDGDGKSERFGEIFKNCPVVKAVEESLEKLAKCILDWSIKADSHGALNLNNGKNINADDVEV